MGELIKAREHGDQVLALYDDEKHRHLADILNHDPKTFGRRLRLASVTWMLGYPDRAVRVSDDARTSTPAGAVTRSISAWALTTRGGRFRLSLRARGTSQARRRS